MSCNFLCAWDLLEPCDSSSQNEERSVAGVFFFFLIILGQVTRACPSSPSIIYDKYDSQKYTLSFLITLLLLLLGCTLFLPTCSAAVQYALYYCREKLRLSRVPHRLSIIPKITFFPFF